MQTATIIKSLTFSVLMAGTAAFAQVKIGSNPTTIDPANNLEVEASTANRVFSLNKTTGKMTYKDGTQALNRVLTSDANGVASWVALKNTGVESFNQTTGVVVTLPTSGTPCTTIPCATDLNVNGSFTVTNATSDVIVEFFGDYNVSNVTAAASYNLRLYADITTVGVFEPISTKFTSLSASICTGGSFTLKQVLQDLPARTYSIKAYALPAQNAGTPATLGIGAKSSVSCGNNDTTGQKLIVTVSE